MRQEVERFIGPEEPSSRYSRRAAGWDRHSDKEREAAEARADLLLRRVSPKWDSFSWLTVRALLESVNDVVGKAGPTIVRRARARWVSGQLAAGVARPPAPGGGAPPNGSFGPDFVVDWTALEAAGPRFILIGDPGEADASQYAAVAPLLAVHRGDLGVPGASGAKASDFMVIVSDVVYPAGDINEYVNAFYLPYRDYDAPIYALPGNHDWYDGLNGFMYHFCGAEPLPRETFRRWSYGPGDQAALALWRGAGHPDGDTLAGWMAERRRKEADRDAEDAQPAPPRAPRQPGPYFAIDVGSLLIVAIDTGISGEIDAEQGQWLRRVSSRPGPKILLTGKPIYVDNAYHPCKIAWDPSTPEAKRMVGDEPSPLSVDDIVREPQHRYLAAIGGDIHNYQRYPVRLTDGRTIQYIVSGGGGAYLSATHTIERVGPRCEQKLPPEVKDFSEGGGPSFDEDGFRCYPLRGDSLAMFTKRVGPVLFNTILSAFVLVAAGILELLWVLSGGFDVPEPSRWAILAAIVGAALLAVAFLAVFVAGWVKPALVIEKVPVGWRGLMFLGLVGIVAAVVASGLILIAEPRISEAVGITLAFPLVFLAGVIVAYNLRGSAPAVTPVLLLVAPVVVAAEGALGFRLRDGWDGFLYLLLPLIVTIGAVAALDTLRRRIREQGRADRWRTFKAVLGAVWAAATVGLLINGDRSDWLWQSVALLAAAGLLITVAIPRLSRSRAVREPTETYGIGSGPAALIGLAFATLGLLLLESIEGFAARATAAAFSAVPAILGLAVIGLAALAKIGFRTLWRMRTGNLDPELAAALMADHVGGGVTPVREPAMGRGPARTANDGHVKMAAAVRRLGKAVSELADTNEPPFYKNFLSVEAVDDRLVIRCHGVTGDACVPTLEDCISIPLSS